MAMAMAATHSGHSSPTIPTSSTSSTTSTTPTTILTLEKSQRGRFRVVSHAALRNNLLAAVGYLELGNAGDFAANVWNEIPVPRHAVILMAIGGPIALLVSLVAARDLYLSWKNVSILYAERKALLAVTYPDGKTSAVLGVNTRELGTEGIDRVLMDIFLGFGALLVGVGTIMAIWGADHRVFHASNLLSGFVGNSFAAIFGVFNAVWSAYLVYRFQVRYKCCNSNPGVQMVRLKLRRRFRMFQWHAVINGATGLVAGMASMVTAVMWWGYVVLIPCVATMIAGNLFWRKKLGYDRPIMVNSVDNIMEGEKNDIDNDRAGEILDSLASIEAAQSRLHDLAEAGSLNRILCFLEEQQILEYFCDSITRGWPDHPLFAASDTVTISCDDLKGGTEDEKTRMQQECRQFLSSQAGTLLEHREQYLLELAGEAVWNGSI
ncbi:hypothetical protein BJX76DRAFT_244961 [Aspergillus varians]